MECFVTGWQVKPILIIKAGETFDTTRQALGDFEDWILARLGRPAPPVRVVAPFRDEALPSAGEVSAAIVTGSHHMVSDRESWSEMTAAWLDQNLDQLPILGICYGHQLLAHARGGRIGYHPGGVELGTTDVRLTPEAAADPLFGLLGTSGFPAHVAHRQTVLALPAGAVRLAGNDFEPHHAFRLGPKAWGVQFHPEFDERVAREYIVRQKETLEADPAVIPRLLASLRPTPQATALLEHFARIVGDGSGAGR